jgi:hypothetical protein
MRKGVTRRLAALGALGTFAAATLIFGPAACLFPDYTFDLKTNTGGAGGTGGGTSSSSSSSTSSTTSSSGTGGAMPLPEDCLDGTDNNGDGKVDCEDPLCQADYECVEPIPTGWGTPGYVALYEGAATATPPDCPTDLPTAVYTGSATLNVQPAACVACGCATPAYQTLDCQLQTDLNPAAGIQAMQVSDVACGAVGATQLIALTVPTPPWGGACFHAESLPGGQLCSGHACNTSVQSSLPTVTGGACQPTGGTATKPPVKWASSAVACHGTRQGKGCTGGQVCMPKPKTPFKPRVCVEKPGDVECPAGSGFQNKNVYFTDFTDTRDCTGCACGNPSGGSCEITLSLWSDSGAGVCSTASGSFKAGQCFNLSGNPGILGWSDQVTKAPSGGTCQPTLTTGAVGTVVEKNPTTICCL